MERLPPLVLSLLLVLSWATPHAQEPAADESIDDTVQKFLARSAPTLTQSGGEVVDPERRDQDRKESPEQRLRKPPEQVRAHHGPRTTSIVAMSSPGHMRLTAPACVPQIDRRPCHVNCKSGGGCGDEGIPSHVDPSSAADRIPPWFPTRPPNSPDCRRPSKNAEI